MNNFTPIINYFKTIKNQVLYVTFFKNGKQILNSQTPLYKANDTSFTLYNLWQVGDINIITSCNQVAINNFNFTLHFNNIDNFRVINNNLFITTKNYNLLLHKKKG